MGYISPKKNVCELIQEHDNRIDALEGKKTSDKIARGLTYALGIILYSYSLYKTFKK